VGLGNTESAVAEDIMVYMALFIGHDRGDELQHACFRSIKLHFNTREEVRFPRDSDSHRDGSYEAIRPLQALSGTWGAGIGRQ
jgi:hypothetical protein